MAAPLKYLPPANFTVAPQAVLNQVAAPSRAQDQQATLAAENAPLRVTVGTDRIGAHVAYALAYQGKLVLLCVWGLGEIDSISDIEIDGADAPAAVAATHYTGTSTQPVDSLLAAAFAAQTPPKSWTSALPGIAYSVFLVPPGLGTGFPNITALIAGLRLYDPRKDRSSNWVQFSEDVTGNTAGVGWAVNQVTRASNVAAAPDGATTADQVTDNNTAASALCWNQTLYTMQPGAQFCVACYLKNISATKGVLNCSSATVDYEVAFTWSAGAPSALTPNNAAVTNARAEAVGAGWYRLSYTVTPGADAAPLNYTPIRYFPNGRSSPSTASTYIWGLSLNEGAELLPYVPVGPALGTHRRDDPATWEPSGNPSLALARFIENDDGFGMARTVSRGSLIVAANANDELVGGEKRRLIGLTLDAVQPDRSWVEALRTYAGCFVVGLATAEVKLVPDRPRAAVRTLDFNAGDILDYGGIEQADILQSPTFVQVQWRDTTSNPWRDTYGPGAYAPGVAAGTADYIPSQVALPGIRRRSQAAREEIERVNKLNLANLSLWVDVFDEALALEVGDRVDVILPDLGATAKPMVVARIEGEYGRYRLSLIEYDPAVYSDAIVAEPTWSDTTLPTPANPPAPTNLLLTEEWSTAADGANRTRIRATWTGVTYPFLHDYRVTIRQGASIIDTIPAATAEARSGTLVEGQLYQVDVQTISTSGAASAALSATRTLTGSTTPPGNVTTWYTALEAGGKVLLAWAPVAGVTRYRVKYGATGGSYATATLIDDFDATTKEIAGIPPGTWRFYLVALSRAGLESLVPLTRDIVVTLDTNVLNTSHTFTSPSLTNMAYTQPDRTAPGYWITDFADGFGFGHADTNNATGTFADLSGTIFADPHTAGTSGWESESWDFGAVTAGDWNISIAAAALSGSGAIKVRLSTDNATWTDTAWTGAPVKAAARYMRIRVEGTGTIQVMQGASATVTVVKRRDANGGRVVTTNASGAKTVTLAGNYVLGAPQVSLKGTTAGSVRWDNLVLGAGTNSFDIYAFNSAGAQIAADVSWAFEGI